VNKQQMNGSSSALGAAERSEDERSETERSAAASRAVVAGRPNPEVRPRAQRRTFPVAYKEKILTEADAAVGSGAIGALLRREGLYSSHLTHWRQERSAGITQGLTPRTRGPRPHPDTSAKQLQQLRRENERLTERLRKAEIIIDVQKKVASLLGMTLAAPEPGDLL
jgi:transposase-like protein